MAKMNEKDRKKENKVDKKADSSLDETLNNPAFELDEESKDKKVNENSNNESNTSSQELDLEEEVDKGILQSKDKQIEELSDRLRRTMAEFDNFRKRTEKEKSQMYGMGEKNVLEALLPVIDNFERALSFVPQEEKEDSFIKGVDMIYKQLITTLESLGVKEIEAVGKSFDPNLHNAVMHEENSDFGENEVVEQFLKGYMYKDTVLRYSMVKVAN